MPRSISQQLEHDLHCAIETGNVEEAKLVIAQAESAFDDGLINSDTLAELVFDLHNNFEV